MIDILGLGLTIFMVYIAVYSLVSRICECVERCARMKYNNHEQQEVYE